MLEGTVFMLWGVDPIGTDGIWGCRLWKADTDETWPTGCLVGWGKADCPTGEVRGGDTWAVEENCGAGKRWKGPAAGGPYDGGDGFIDGAIDLSGGIGLKPEASDPTTGLEDKKGAVIWETGGRDGLKAEEASDPTTGPEDKKGVVVCGAGGCEGCKVETWDPTERRDDKKGIILCGEGKGEVAGLEGKFAWLGSSVPILYLTIDLLSLLCFHELNCH